MAKEKIATLKPNGVTVMLVDATLSILCVGLFDKVMEFAKMWGYTVDTKMYDAMPAKARINFRPY